jgi:hypothetical protein
MRHLLHAVAIVSICAIGAGPAVSGDAAAGGLEISGAWAKASLKGVPNSAAYMAITNTGASADRLVAADADVSKAVELHTMSVSDGVMRMRKLEDGLTVPAGETVTLAPGGEHIMLIGLEAQLEAGAKFDIRLEFENAGAQSISVEVRDTPPEAAEDGQS